MLPTLRTTGEYYVIRRILRTVCKKIHCSNRVNKSRQVEAKALNVLKFFLTGRKQKTNFKKSK